LFHSSATQRYNVISNAPIEREYQRKASSATAIEFFPDSWKRKSRARRRSNIDGVVTGAALRQFDGPPASMFSVTSSHELPARQAHTFQCRYSASSLDSG